MTLEPSEISATLLYPYLNHAARMYGDGYASRGDIDAGMRFGCGYPVGPLAALDEIGLDVVRDALAQRHARTGDPLHAPASVLEKHIADGRTGRQAGRGFYTYDDTGAVIDDAETPSADDAPTVRHEVRTVGVIGTGTMAAGIAEVFAKAGYDVVCKGRSQERLETALAGIARNLDRAIAKGRSDEETKAAVLARISLALEPEALGVTDLVVEAIAEDLELKQALFSDVQRVVKPGTILATTTSSLPIQRCAEAAGEPGSVIGMHFFNPAPVMKLVEVVRTPTTAAEVDESVRAICARIGKVAVSCEDRAGFIVNALLFPYLNDAIALAESGECDYGEIDAAIKAEVGLPMGPFELLDVVGNDVSLAILRQLHAEFAQPGFAPAPTLVELVDMGRLGRKAGAGFHSYA